MRNVFTIIDEISAGLTELKAVLRPLAAFAGGSNTLGPRQARKTGRRRSRRGRRVSKSTGAPQKPTRTTTTKTKKAVSPKIRAARVQQGKYLAALRNLTVQQRAQVKKAKAEGDYGAALKLAASLQRKSA